jgi:hypothetical protein
MTDVFCCIPEPSVPVPVNRMQYGSIYLTTPVFYLFLQWNAAIESPIALPDGGGGEAFYGRGGGEGVI